MSEANCLIILYNYFLIYLPVILLITLITIVYSSYFFQYLYILIVIDPNDTQNFILYRSTSLNSAKIKGYILFILTFTIFLLMLISLLRTVFADPGYFPSPLELEFKILNAGKDKNKIQKNNFISKFNNSLTEGPLSYNEQEFLEKELLNNYSETQSEESMQLKFTNEEIIEKNKKNYVENKTIKNTNSCFSNENVYLDIYKNVDITKMTFCASCLRLKVERSHHCKQCQKCILKMDHHCPWLANCIGFYNLKYFLLLQFYGILSCLIFLFTFWEVIVGYNLSYDATIVQCWYTISVYLFNIGLFAFLIWLCMINWKNLFLGQTVIENSERQRFPSTKSVNIYDMGPYRNFTNVFGRNPLLWFIPFCPNTSGNGYIFETNQNFEFKFK